MTVEFIGYIGSNLSSEIIPNKGPAIDKTHVEEAARIHDEGGFDRALIAFGSSSPESQIVTAYAATRRPPWRRASSPPSISSPTAVSPCTSSPAATTRRCARTAIT